jgi:phosphoglycolate phosphatase-like HAD superfamily hydrolase
VRLVLFDVDGTLVDHNGAAAAGAQQWLMAMGWADAGTIAGLVSEWDEIAERHFPAYQAHLTTFQGQRRLRLREFLPRVGIDASTLSDGRLDNIFNTYLVAYEAAWRSFPDAEPCLGALRRVAHYKPAQVAPALAAKIQTLPEALRGSLTWDQGVEMRDWKQVRMATDMAIYFCDPHAPWQRGTNENTNGLLRQYFPKGTDLSVHSGADLDWVAAELNDRPRKRLAFRKPIEEIKPLLLR